MFLNSLNEWVQIFQKGLLEDDVFFDYTSDPLSQNSKKIKTKIIAKQEGVWVGSFALQAAAHCAKENGYSFVIKKKFQDGDFIKNKTEVAHLEGDAHVILAYERTLLNIISYTSGIATQVNEFVEIVSKNKIKLKPRITATRKTLPYYKKLALYSVKMGGGDIHRASLSSGILVKENHIHAYGGIKNAVSILRKSSPHLLKIEVEVRDMEELQEALDSKSDVVMLDNFSPKEITDACQIIGKAKNKPLIEVSGGVNKDNLESYLINGVDIISVGAFTHSVTGFDFSLLYLK